MLERYSAPFKLKCNKCKGLRVNGINKECCNKCKGMGYELIPTTLADVCLVKQEDLG